MFSLNVGDKIKLIAPMGVFRSVGTVCTVDRVESKTIWFSCSFSNGGGNGCVSMDEFCEYFEKVDSDDTREDCGHCESCNDIVFAIDDVVYLARSCYDLPFEVGSRFIVSGIGYGAVTLTSLDDNDSFTITNNLLTMYFEIEVDQDDEEEIELPDRITNEQVEALLEQSKFNFTPVFDMCVIGACKLPNGIVLNAAYGFRCPEEFDLNKAKEECMKQFAHQIWNFETYALMNCHYNCAE